MTAPSLFGQLRPSPPVPPSTRRAVLGVGIRPSDLGYSLVVLVVHDCDGTHDHVVARVVADLATTRADAECASRDLPFLPSLF